MSDRCKALYAKCLLLGGQEVWHISGRTDNSDLARIEDRVRELTTGKTELQGLEGEARPLTVPSGSE